MKLRLLFFQIAYSVVIHAQTTNYIYDYFPHIYQAEEFILNGEYHLASQQYQIAFEQARGGFTEDFANAAVCASKVKQFNLAYRWLDSLIGRGVDESFFNEFSGLKEIRRHDRWSLYMTYFSNKRAMYSPPRDSKIKSRLQKINNDHRKIHALNEQVFKDTINIVDVCNVAVFQNILFSSGYPSESQLGVSWPGEPLPISTFLFYHCQSFSLNNNGKYDFTEEFELAVQQGRMEPHYLAYLQTIQSPQENKFGIWGIETNSIGENKQRKYLIKFESEQLTTINKNRRNTGLESIESYKRKIKFKLNNTNAADFCLFKLNYLFLSVVPYNNNTQSIIQHMERID